MKPWPLRLADAGVILLLCWLPSLLLVPVYGSFAPVWVWGAAGLLCTLVVLGAARLGWPWWTTIPLATALVLLVGPVLLGDGIGPAASAGLARAAVTGWRDMLTVAVPIGTTGDLLAPPLFAGAVFTLAGQTLVTARLWGLVFVPVGLAAALAALLGPADGVPAQAVVLLAATVLIGVGWVSWRRHRGLRAIRSRATRWRRPAAAAAVLVVAVGAGLLLVPAEQPGSRFALRTDLAVPVDPSAFPSPLSDYRRYVGDGAAAPQFAVTGARPGDLLRVAALDAYDGQTFSATPAEGPFARIGATRPAATVGAERSITVTVDEWTGPWVPTIGDLTSIQFRTDALTDGFRYSGVAVSGLIPAGLPVGTGWQQSGVVSDVSAAAGDTLVGGSWPQTAPIPDALRVAAVKYAAGATTPAEQLAAIAEALSSTGYYSSGQDGQLRSPSGHGINRLLAMVDGNGMVGDAEQYAALMAVLARALGIPARVVVGFAVPDASTQATDGSVPIVGADLAAWVEVQFQQSGWVGYDPTPPKTRDTIETEPQTQAGRHIPDNQPPPAAAGADAAQVEAGDSQHDNDAGDSDADNPDQSGGPLPWWFWAGLGLVALGLLLMVPVVLILAMKSARRRRRQFAPTANAQLRGAWREVLDRGADVGFTPSPGSTRREASAALWVATAVDTRALADAADRAQFAPVALAPSAADAGWAAARSSSDALLAGRGLRARWRARLSLASLRAGRRRG